MLLVARVYAVSRTLFVQACRRIVMAATTVQRAMLHLKLKSSKEALCLLQAKHIPPTALDWTHPDVCFAIADDRDEWTKYALSTSSADDARHIYEELQNASLSLHHKALSQSAVTNKFAAPASVLLLLASIAPFVYADPEMLLCASGVFGVLAGGSACKTHTITRCRAAVDKVAQCAKEML